MFKRKVNIQALVESALLVAIAFGLSYAKIPIAAMGGSVTVVSMLPLLIVGLRHGLTWGIGAGIVYGFLQILQQFHALPANNPLTLFASVALDYFVAFGVLGLSALFRRTKYALVYASVLCLTLRYLSHTLAGVLVWESLWGASFAYNATYMVTEIILTTIVSVIIVKTKPLSKYLKYEKPVS